jgi:hypothetical protein
MLFSFKRATNKFIVGLGRILVLAISFQVFRRKYSDIARECCLYENHQPCHASYSSQRFQVRYDRTGQVHGSHFFAFVSSTSVVWFRPPTDGFVLSSVQRAQKYPPQVIPVTWLKTKHGITHLEILHI